MAPRKPIPPPVKCGGTAKHTGQPCKRWAVPGSAVCKHHGAYGGRNGRAAAEDLHEARQIEAVVASQVQKVMIAAGFPAGLVSAEPVTVPRSPSPSRIAREDEQLLDAAMERLAATLAAVFEDDPTLHSLACEVAGSGPAPISEAPPEPQPEPSPIPEPQPEPEPSPVPEPVPAPRPRRITTQLGVQPPSRPRYTYRTF